jgi:hypothetical protein
MTEETYKAFIPVIKGYISVSHDIDETIVLVLCIPAAKYDDFRSALIDCAKDNGSDGDCRWVALKCLSNLAPTHPDVREALDYVAKNDKNDPLRQFAADALESLATSQLAGQKQLLEQQQL